VLDVYSASTGEVVGQWTSPLIEAGAALEVAMSDIIGDVDTVEPILDLPGHLNVELDSAFNGYLQHIIRNATSDVLTDMSAKCALGGNG
jgi:hypothetical protein